MLEESLPGAIIRRLTVVHDSGIILFDSTHLAR